jgi:virulence factor
MRIGVIGLGDIARKAYLPVLATRADLEVHLCTRDPEVLHWVGDSYRIPHRHADVDSLLSAGVDAAFVHAATAAHVDVVSALLDAGVHTYVDKPLTDNLPAAAALVAKARSAERSLMVGFNRRYAPVYRQLIDVHASLVLMQKNRLGLPGELRRVVFDDFIHVVDTLRFLAPLADDLDVQATIVDGLLHRLVVTLTGGGVTAIGLMNRDGGATEEVLEVHGPGIKRRVVDMADVVDHAGGVQTVSHRGDWTAVEQQRGFEAICAQFLESVAAGLVLDAGDALRTHEVCEAIVGAVAAQ